MSGIIVSNATYGDGTNQVDVTSVVSSMIKDGVLSIPSISPSSLNVNDPSPGVLKTLTVIYTINGGEKLTETEKDNGTLYINAPPERIGSGLQITKAEYGVDGNLTDVTDALQNMIKNGSINLKVGFKELGLPDPNPSKQKSLTVEYTINGAKNTRTLVDGNTFKESAPSQTRPSNFKTVNAASSFIWTIFKGVFYCIVGYIWGMSVKVSYYVGDSLGAPAFLFGGIGALTGPGFSFILLPIILFFRRLIFKDVVLV
jgi:hypothetical protein